jgi:uncharacterized integral membrane protein
VASAARAKPRRTRTAAAWTATIVGVITSIALIIFIAQNTAPVRVTFLSLHGRFPLAVALLVAAAGAVLIVLILGTARITQLRLAARRLRRGA